jgi:hypothetical protein
VIPFGLPISGLARTSYRKRAAFALAGKPWEFRRGAMYSQTGSFAITEISRAGLGPARNSCAAMILGTPSTRAARIAIEPGYAPRFVFRCRFACNHPSERITNPVWNGAKPMMLRESGPMDVWTATGIVLIVLTSYSAWLTSIIFCAANDHRPLLIAGATFFPVGIVHGVGIWFGG